MTKKYDAIIIGAGQAGPSLAVDLANHGLQVAIIERKLFGGTCVNTGCIPSKTLIANAYAAHLVRRAEDYGVIIDGDIAVDMKKVKARKDAIVNKSQEGIKKWLLNTKNCEVYEGHAYFEDSHTLRVNEDLLEADKIFINVGARAFIPPITGLDFVDYFDNSSMMEVDFLPEHLIIVGGSYIGLEFAQMYRRFGSEVTIVEKASRLISREDEDVSEAVYDILQREGINIRLNAECISVKKQNDKILMGLDCKDESKQVAGSHLLIAVGRRPNTDDLGLDKAGVKVDERGFIKVDEQLHTSVTNIWALGECNGKGAFTHTSYNDYEIVRDNLLRKESRSIHDRILTYALFTDPPLARIGMTENEARKSGKNILKGTRLMSRVSRASEKGETEGFIKILVDADSQEIIGASILGLNGDEAIHCLLDVMYSKKPYTVITHAVHIHPTVSELLPTVLGDLKSLGD